MKIINFDRRLSLINSPIINCAHCKINERTFLLQTIIESSVLCARIYFLILCKWRHVLLLTSFFYVTDAVLQNKTKTLFYTKKVRIVQYFYFMVWYIQTFQTHTAGENSCNSGASSRLGPAVLRPPLSQPLGGETQAQSRD